MLPLVPSLVPFLEPYLPKPEPGKIFVTLTYAASLDSRVAAGRGQQTAISHLETKTMTHYLRSFHDGILIGAGTAISDDPALNCRFNFEDRPSTTPRPIILDPRGRWVPRAKSRVIQLAHDKKGLGPWIVVARGTNVDKEVRELVESVKGQIISSEVDSEGNFEWAALFEQLRQLGLYSIMVEGGASVINDLLVTDQALVNALIVTIGPLYLGRNGVEVSPAKTRELTNISWWSGIRDSIMAAHIKQ